MQSTSRIRKLAIAAIFIALNLVFTRLLYVTVGPSRYSLGLLPIHYAGYWFGPFWGLTVGIISDLIGIVINPQGAPHLGIMFTMGLRGLIAGLIAYLPKKEMSPFKVVGTVVFDTLVCSLLLMSLWLSQLRGNPYDITFIARVPAALIQAAILIAAEILLLPVFSRVQKDIPVKKIGIGELRYNE